MRDEQSYLQQQQRKSKQFIYVVVSTHFWVVATQQYLWSLSAEILATTSLYRRLLLHSPITRVREEGRHDLFAPLVDLLEECLEDLLLQSLGLVHIRDL